MGGNEKLVKLLISYELKSMQDAGEQEKTQRLKMFLNARIKRVYFIHDCVCVSALVLR